MSEFYIMRVETMTGEKVGTARLYFSVVPSTARDFFYSSDGYTIIQEQYKAATGYDLDVNSSYGFSGVDPVNLPACAGWNVYIQNNFTRRFDVTSLTQTLKYIFKNGSYITMEPPVPLPSDSHGIQMVVRYYTEAGSLVLTAGINVRVYNEYLGTFESCTIYCLPWKGYYQGNDYYWFVIPNMNAYAGRTNVLQLTLSATRVDKTLADQFFNGVGEPNDPDDPYPDDDSDDDNPDDPDGIPDGDDIPIPPLPDVDITDTGFITLYRPSLAQVKTLANYMWSDLFSLASFKKLFADPMDCILGFNVLPVVVRAGGVSEVTVGNISTGVSMTECASQWVEVDCGTVNIGTPYDTYLDYSPYTKYSIYLPYIGLQSLSADDVVGKPIHLVYHIDALSCSCVAYLLCGGSVLYQFAGSCGYSIPLTGDSFRSMVSSMISIATTVAGAVASGGMSAPLAIGTGASVAQNVTNAKPEVRRSGSVGSSAGIMGVQKPYLILEIPRICKPKDQHRYLGYPSFITDSVGNVPGYSEWESVILSGVPCTDEERSAIEEILKGGVYNV